MPVDVVSEVSLIHPDDIYWFIILDETHHKLSLERNKGGTTKLLWINPLFPRSGDRVVATQNNITGVYTCNLAGEFFPPLYIFKTKSKIPEKFNIDPQVCGGLPVVSGMFGQNEIRSYTSEVAVRKKGSMDTSLWSAYNRQCVLHPMRGEISPLPVRDPITKKLITGPLIKKTDGGPCRLSKEAESVDFREKYAA